MLGLTNLGIIPALRRALGQIQEPAAYLEFICSPHPVYAGWVR